MCMHFKINITKDKKDLNIFVNKHKLKRKSLQKYTYYTLLSRQKWK